MKKLHTLVALFIISILSCDSPKNAENTGKDTTISIDYLWNDCAFLSDQELDTLDNLQKTLNQRNTPEQDRPIFEEYINILTLVDKNDQQLLTCVPSTPALRERLMRHFVFLGKRYGSGEFSFVDKPRLASHFEREYFYFYPKRDFLKKSMNTDAQYSKSDETLARYLLGAIIVMQASSNATKDLALKANAIAQGFSSLKYGRSSIFTRILFDYQKQLNPLVMGFLAHKGAFMKAFLALNQVSPGTYPMLLKKDYPYYFRDFSEFEGASEKNVFGVSSGTGGGSPLLTGSFGQLSGKVLFVTSGHWSFNKKASIMRQIDAEPLGSAESKLEWLNEQLDIFNFSEELFVPILKALEFSHTQVSQLQKQLGSNPFGGSFLTFHRFLPWSDIAIALPSQNLLNKTGVKQEKINIPLKALPLDRKISYTAYTVGFGLTENLESNSPSDKPSGFKRLTGGNLLFSSFIDRDGLPIIRLALYTPISLELLTSHPLKEKAFSISSMRFGARCSGSPIRAKGNTVGVLQGEIIDNNSHYSGIRTVHFTTELLELISELINDPRGLHGIPETDLVQRVRRHMFDKAQTRQKIRNDFIKALSL